jgi:hypothetical protein
MSAMRRLALSTVTLLGFSVLGCGSDPLATPSASPPPGEEQVSYGGLTPNTTPERQVFDLFDEPGHRFWVEVDEAQLERMNAQSGGGPGPVIDDARNGDIYTPGTDPTFADHLLVQHVSTGSVADYGKMQVALVGESTFRGFTPDTIPNLRFDTDEFTPGRQIGTFEHFRLNNGLVGTIFRELVAHRVFGALGYPALRASYAFLGSNVWGEDIWVPMTLIEVYKTRFCEDNADILGGGCTNMWEFPGEIRDVGDQDVCQLSSCDNGRLKELTAALEDAPRGKGFKQALDPFIDWQRFHEFQCIGWMLLTGDDALRNGNNNLVIEREDGRLIWAPYSVDISASQDWFERVSLYGTQSIADGCQKDADCWADTVEVCEGLVEAFDALDPESFVDDAYGTLFQLGMLRSGDQGRAEELRNWYAERQQELYEELEIYRDPPGPDGCPSSLMRCEDGSCGTQAECAERACFEPLSWCEALGQCVDPAFEECPGCAEDLPYYCALNAECVASVEACAALCDVGLVYCENLKTCAPACDIIEADLDAAKTP